jgi:hypothetical protein
MLSLKEISAWMGLGEFSAWHKVSKCAVPLGALVWRQFVWMSLPSPGGIALETPDFCALLSH